ncbi:Macrophage erythroblast attacher [Babesia sp. Xinjiang]|uniref:Macrophage erythroblast attacher n=1 Tax=Babesia sp. Xinjiang TaxID=462227 RepID=UPI000A225287|nr:Macrophage erythroblast attacher [Babesia sp. Xinjiang]ORM41855.1 Macrophage erythroblast attacher [Babesia sp. Xinjiang]
MALDLPADDAGQSIVDADQDGPIRRPRRALDDTHCPSSNTNEDISSNKDPRRRRQQAVGIVDRALVAVPYQVGQSSLKQLERILDKDLLLITSFLTKRLVKLGSRQVVIEKLNRAIERLRDLETSLRNIDESLDTRISEIITRIVALEKEPELTINQFDASFRFEDHRKRVSWIVAKYLARRGYIRAASHYTANEDLRELLDSELFLLCDRVYRELKAHKLDSALEWAVSQSETLARHKSTFLDEIRVQQVVLRLKDGDLEGATLLLKSFGHAMLERCEDSRKLFSALVLLRLRDNRSTKSKEQGSSNKGKNGAENGENTLPLLRRNRGTKDCQRVLLGVPNVFEKVESEQSGSDPASCENDNAPTLVCIYCADNERKRCAICRRYRELMDNRRWDHLAQEFERSVASIYGLSQHPLLESLIHTGLCAVKSTSCKDHRNATCPACLPEWQQYVDEVPTSTKLNSVLICPITGEIMGYDNPPLTSPGGCVVSERGLRVLQRSSTDQDGLVECPRTRQMVPSDEFQKLFIT